MPKTRYEYLDNLSGVLIIFMILFYHLPLFCGLGETCPFVILRSFFDFFMAWFFFKSGMFFKENRSIREEVMKCWHRLIVPYLFINALCIIVPSIIHWGGPATVGAQLKILVTKESGALCAALWFLLSLSIVRIIYATLLGKLGIHPWLLITGFLLLAVGMNIYSYHVADDSLIKSLTGYTVHSWIGNVFLGALFFGLGVTLKQKQFERKELVWICLILYLVHLLFPSYLDFRYNQSPHYLLSIAYYFTGIILFNNLFFKTMNRRIPILTHIGQNSMVYYITHFTFFKLLFEVYARCGISNVLSQFAISFPITILFMILMDYLFRMKSLKWIVGAK